MTLLTGKVVLVTGATGGIGSAVARAVVAEGGDALVHDLRQEDVDSLVAELGPRAVGFASDLGIPTSVDRLWHDAHTVHGRIDALVNNASLFRSTTPESSLDDWVDVWNSALAVNLVAPSILCREAVKAYAHEPGGGVIVNIVSVTAWRGALPDYWHYGAAKGGVAAMTRTIARFYGRAGVTAFGVAPGFVDTPMARSILDEDGLRAAADANALGEITQPSDVADVVVFLVSGRARHATGTMIDVNAANFTR